MSSTLLTKKRQNNTTRLPAGVVGKHGIGTEVQTQYENNRDEGQWQHDMEHNAAVFYAETTTVQSALMFPLHLAT